MLFDYVFGICYICIGEIYNDMLLYINFFTLVFNDVILVYYNLLCKSNYIL